MSGLRKCKNCGNIIFFDETWYTWIHRASMSPDCYPFLQLLPNPVAEPWEKGKGQDPVDPVDSRAWQ